MNTIPQDDVPRKQCTGPCGRILPATTEFFHKSRGNLCPRCKECRNAAGKIYNATRVEERKQRYQENREEISDKQKRFREAHREEIKERKKQAYQQHREEIRMRQKQHRETHREEVKEQKRQAYQKNRTKHRQHYQEHREKMLARAANYRNAHREEIYRRQRQSHQKQRDLYLARRRTYKQQRRARLKSVKGALTVQQIQAKLKAQKYACYYCSTKFVKRKDGSYIYHLDHTIPLSRPEFSPRHDANYIVLACPSCNQSKSDKLPHEWPQGGRLF